MRAKVLSHGILTEHATHYLILNTSVHITLRANAVIALLLVEMIACSHWRTVMGITSNALVPLIEFSGLAKSLKHSLITLVAFRQPLWIWLLYGY